MIYTYTVHDIEVHFLFEHSYSFSSFSSVSPLAFRSLRRLTSHYKLVISISTMIEAEIRRGEKEETYVMYPCEIDFHDCRLFS